MMTVVLVSIIWAIYGAVKLISGDINRSSFGIIYALFLAMALRLILEIAGVY
jgi:hypothetical protein